MREKYSLLLKKAELIRYLVSHDCCKIKEITDELKLGREEFIEIYRSLPLSDQEIAHLLERKLGTPITAGNVLKARQRARAKIRRAISVKAPHERTFIRRKT